MHFKTKLNVLTQLALSLQKSKDLGVKQEILLNQPQVITCLSKNDWKPFLPCEHDLLATVAVYAVLAIGQEEILFAHPDQPPKEKVRELHASLAAIERFYESIGGIVGYHIHILRLLITEKEDSTQKKTIFSKAQGIDLSICSKNVDQAVMAGILAIEETGEIYPIGGLGSRLNLLDTTKEPLPAAYLPFCGRTLLEGLIRDVQGREFLYYRLFDRQVKVPIAMMTSLEKENAAHIEAICHKQKWFGRPKESFFLFSQLSVPVVTNEGAWSMKAPLEMNLQPGGHGALWKAAEEQGVFFWFQNQGKKHLLIRQINNPIAGLDLTLFALVGIGTQQKKAFGFASCERLAGAAEGVLVLVEEEGFKRLSNIEYTNFKRHTIEDFPAQNGYSKYPANTNILYANLQHILPVIKKNPLPGLILNMKNKEPFLCPMGKKSEQLGGRLESMMQNISDALISKDVATLPTFLTYHERRRTISAAKKSYEKGGSLLETPEGAFYDLLYNNHELLVKYCEGQLVPFCSEIEYLERGPSHIFLYHPALGPLYSLISQKIKRPIFGNDSELQLEIADVLLEDLDLNGSLLILAKNILGHSSQGIIRYSQKTGKCVLKSVRVHNKGLHRHKDNQYWKNTIKRFGALKIVLQGHSEFYAENISFDEGQTIVVPSGERWVAEQKGDGGVHYHIEKPSWTWKYQEVDGKVKLHMA